jgi:hypothetical protein
MTCPSLRTWSITLGVMTGFAATLISSGCQSTAVEAVSPECPAALQDVAKVSAAAVPVQIPEALRVNAGSVARYGIVGRRITVSVAPAAAAHLIRIGSSTLSLTTLGGTLAGWAVSTPAGRAIDIIPGRLRVHPYLSSSRLRPQTSTLDVLVIPGGVPIDEMTVTIPALWGSDRTPLAPEALRVTLAAVRHLTVFDAVDANITLEVTLARGPHEWSTCSTSSHFELVDHDSELPALWDLHTPLQPGHPRSWLALYSAATGPLRAIFTSPAAAHAFAEWVMETGATRAGPYGLGLLQPDEPGRPGEPRARLSLPAARPIADAYRPLAGESPGALQVGRLGEK